ncbi:hypothetical protein [Streptomyces sp. NPDC046939]|uniref:hypothetical protein n=1 Tax=Streptomyces sp. NPDC046939 TaxID=3155376 RepID=UPI0034071EFD
MRLLRRNPGPVERAGRYGALRAEAHDHVRDLLDAKRRSVSKPVEVPGLGEGAQFSPGHVDAPVPPDLGAAKERLSARASSPRARSWVLGSPHVPQRRFRVGETLHIATPPYAGREPVPGDGTLADDQLECTSMVLHFPGTDWTWVSLLIDFVPHRSLYSRAQIRPFLPYVYGWRMITDGPDCHESVAGGFAMMVTSRRLDGSDAQQDLYYQYTAYTEHQSGTRFLRGPDGDSDGYAFQFGNEAPEFTAPGGRFYTAAISAFVTTSLDGPMPPARPLRNAAAAISGRMPFVVIARR